MEKIIFGLEIFFFIFSLLNIIKNIYTFIKVVRLKEGKVDTSLVSEIMFGVSLSFVITMLIIGF